MTEHTRPLTGKKPMLFIQELEQPALALCKQLPGLPIVTTLAIGEECYKGQ